MNVNDAFDHLSHYFAALDSFDSNQSYLYSSGIDCSFSCPANFFHALWKRLLSHFRNLEVLLCQSFILYQARLSLSSISFPTHTSCCFFFLSTSFTTSTYITVDIVSCCLPLNYMFTNLPRVIRHLIWYYFRPKSHWSNYPRYDCLSLNS